MQVSIDTKIASMLWDIPENRRKEITQRIIQAPVETFGHDDQLFIKSTQQPKLV